MAVGMEEMSLKLLGLLKCSACKAFLLPDIHQCKYGHNVCSKCRPQLETCPLCLAEMSGPRNLLAEELADMFLSPCENGCGAKYLPKDMKEHAPRCPHREYECELGQRGKCAWRGSSLELSNHVMKNHAHEYCTGETLIMIIPKFDTAATSGHLDVAAVFARDEIFVSYLTVSTERNRIYGAVKHVGPEDTAKNFHYEFQVRTGSDRIIIQRNVCHADFLGVDSIVETGDCFVLAIDIAKKFVVEDEMIVMVRVSKRSHSPTDVYDPSSVEEQALFLTVESVRRKYVNWRRVKMEQRNIEHATPE